VRRACRASISIIAIETFISAMPLGSPLIHFSRPRSKPRRATLRRAARASGVSGAGSFSRFGRPLGKVREEQFGRTRRRLAARDSHGAVGAEKLQRLVGVARHQVVEIAAQGAEAALGRRNCRADIGCGIVAEGAEQLFYGIGEFGDAVEADDGPGRRAPGACWRAPFAGCRRTDSAACAASASPARSSARSISPLTQDSGPMSRSMLISSCWQCRGS
jgi:hypothetical protein